MPELRLQIDELKLDKEWIDQPIMFHEHAIQAAEARRDWDHTKNALDIIKAEIANAIRSNPVRFGLVKATDKATEEAVLCQQDYQTALSDVAKARYALEIANAAVEALEHKKRALEKLVDLHGRDYFSSPRATTEATAEIQKEADMDIGGKQKRRPPEAY